MSNAPTPLELADQALPDAHPEDVRREVLRNGTEVLIRPIRRSDLELERGFIEALSPRARRFRFLDSMATPSSALLRQLVEIDAATDAAFVAMIVEDGNEREVGVARFSTRAGSDDCEFAVTVGDAWQRQGLGTLLMQRLIEIARARGIASMHSSDAADNDLMRKFGEHLHFSRERDPDDATQLIYRVDLTAPARTPSTV